MRLTNRPPARRLDPHYLYGDLKHLPHGEQAISAAPGSPCSHYRYSFVVWASRKERCHYTIRLPPDQNCMRPVCLRPETDAGRAPPQHVCPRIYTASAMFTRQLTRMQIETCYRALLNMQVSRTDELSRHQRLHDKQLRVESILASLREQGADAEQLAEVGTGHSRARQKELTPSNPPHFLVFFKNIVFRDCLPLPSPSNMSALDGGAPVPEILSKVYFTQERLSDIFGTNSCPLVSCLHEAESDKCSFLLEGGF